MKIPPRAPSSTRLRRGRDGTVSPPLPPLPRPRRRRLLTSSLALAAVLVAATGAGLFGAGAPAPAWAQPPAPPAPAFPDQDAAAPRAVPLGTPRRRVASNRRSAAASLRTAPGPAPALAQPFLPPGSSASAGGVPAAAAASATTGPGAAPGSASAVPSAATPSPEADAVAASMVKPVPETIQPTWETQPDARTLYFAIPAPRGQIVDRNGLPLAQNRLGYHLDLSFPGGVEMSDAQVVAYVRQYLVTAQGLLQRPLELSTNEVLDHYRNRSMLPMDLVTYLSPEEVERLRGRLNPPLSLRPVYLRFYPNGPVAAHLLGYVGKTGAQAHGPLQPNELLWPKLEGREGLELTFNDQLNGQDGYLNLTFDGRGHKTSERIINSPSPGRNVVTTLDLNLQRLCEETLAKSCRRGSIVITDPNNGDVLALASWPSFDPNLFVPAISEANFRRLNEDRDNPLIPRAYRSSYPAGSTFKVVVGLAALESRTIDKDDTFDGPSAMTIGDVVMHNWKKHDAGQLNFVQALAQSCNTWFFQVGIKTGADEIVDWGQRLGFGRRTGLPLRDEDKGVMPDNDYMRRVHKRRLLEGDIANLAIGQGDLLVTPVQMAQAMGIIANGGTFYQTRLVRQVQSLTNEISVGYPVQPRNDVAISEDVARVLRKGMVMVVEHGTAHKAQVPGIKVAGKTGTAQWGGNGNASRERKAAWFAGFAPADKPRYAFAALYESEPGEAKAHGGDKAAPMIGKVLREAFKDQKPPPKKSRGHSHDDDDDDQMDGGDDNGGADDSTSNKKKDRGDNADDDTGDGDEGD